MTIETRSLAALLIFSLALGCTTTSVRTTSRRVMTAEEAAQADRDRREAKEGKPRPAAAKPPATVDEEIERLRGEIEREPQNPKWHFMLGLVYERLAERAQGPERQGQLELAEIRYRRGSELIPAGQYTGPHFYLGRVLFKEQKWAPALAELKKALAVKPPDLEGYYLNPDYRESHYLIGAILYREGALDESKQNFKLYLKYGGDAARVVDFFPELLAE